LSHSMTPPVFRSLLHIHGWDGSVGRGFSVILCAMLGLKETLSLLAAWGHHVSWPRLPQRPPAALHFDWIGVVGLAACGIMNLVNLSSLELILVWVSCSIETCSVSWVIVTNV